MPARLRHWIPCAVFACFASVATAAHAQTPDKERCTSAYDDGQRLKLRGQLLEARARLAVCASESCPAALRPECLQWSDEVGRAMPTLVVSARDAAGADLTDVTFLVDGRTAARVGDPPIELDPGEHTVSAARPGAAAVHSSVVLVEGEKARHLVVTFPAPSPPLSAPLDRTVRPVPVATWVAGSTGIAALGVFAVFAAAGAAQYGQLDPCKCSPPDAVSADKTKFLLADVALGVGIVALATAAVFYFTRPTVHLNATGTKAGARALLEF